MFNAQFRTIRIEAPPGIWDRIVQLLRGRPQEHNPELVEIPAPAQLGGRDFAQLVDRHAQLAQIFDHPVIL